MTIGAEEKMYYEQVVPNAPTMLKRYLGEKCYKNEEGIAIMWSN